MEKFSVIITNEKRVIVSPICWNYCDLDTLSFTYKDREYTLIDTAGLRRKSKVNDSIEDFSVIRAVTAVER